MSEVEGIPGLNDVRTLVLPGTRDRSIAVIWIAMLALWAYIVFWEWLAPMIVAGWGLLSPYSGFLPHAGPPVLAWALWAVFAALPLVWFRSALFDLARVDTLVLGDGALLIDRTVRGVKVSPSALIPADSIVSVTYEPRTLRQPGSGRLTPRTRGSVVIEGAMQTVRVGGSLEDEPGKGDAAVRELEAWLRSAVQ